MTAMSLSRRSALLSALLGSATLCGALLCTSAQAQILDQALDWITRFEDKILAFEALPAPPSGGMVVAGNSNIVMWPNLEADLAPLPAIKRGFGGSTTAELAYYLDRLVLSAKPASVVICEGENDFGVGDDENDIAARHAEIIERIHAFDPKIRVYVIGLKPSPYRFDRWDLYKATNALLESVCADAAPCTYIPPPAGLLDSSGKPIPSLYLDDQLHLNAAGYAVWTAAIRPILIEGEGEAAGIAPRTPAPPPGFNAHKT